VLDRRSPEAVTWRPLYKTKRWQDTRDRILVRDLYTCRKCKRFVAGKGEAHVDHIVKHNGDIALFWCGDEGLQTLCSTCHSSAKQSEERTGYSKAIGADGWPTDDRHPANKREAAMRRLADR
jgi:5-methylcytosine-specific restriction protein A